MFTARFSLIFLSLLLLSGPVAAELVEIHLIDLAAFIFQNFMVSVDLSAHIQFPIIACSKGQLDDPSTIITIPHPESKQ